MAAHQGDVGSGQNGGESADIHFQEAGVGEVEAGGFRLGLLDVVGVEIHPNEANLGIERCQGEDGVTGGAAQIEIQGLSCTDGAEQIGVNPGGRSDEIRSAKG
jgi:hypothetical protein